MLIWVKDSDVEWLGGDTGVRWFSPSDLGQINAEEGQRIENRITFTDKVLVAGLILSVVSFVWGVYQWGEERKRDEKHAKATE